MLMRPPACACAPPLIPSRRSFSWSRRASSAKGGGVRGDTREFCNQAGVGMTPDAAPGIGQAIQFAVAPALLLVGIGNVLNVVAVRLARVVDRARALERHLPEADEAERRIEVDELRVLDRRMKVCHASVGFITASGLLTCLVVVMLFVNSLRGLGYVHTVSILFVAAMGSLGVGLLLFLAEITIAIRVVKVSRQHVGSRKD